MDIPGDMFDDDADEDLAQRLLRKLKMNRVFKRNPKQPSTISTWVSEPIQQVRRVLDKMVQSPRVPLERRGFDKAVYLSELPSSTGFASYSEGE